MVVVDFKTDRELDGALERYEKQVSIYATAIGRTVGLRHRRFSCDCKSAQGRACHLGPQVAQTKPWRLGQW